MSEDKFSLSRRKALAALGTIGVASAGAGLGTSAYFSDQETFENNSLTAGTLDMKVAATEYYSDWSPDEAQYAGMASDSDSTDIRLPPGDDQDDAQAIALDLDDNYQGEGDVYGAFFDAISSDENGNPYNEVNGGVAAAGDGGLCGTESDANGPVIIDIGDVKPGDFGGAQFAFELCDNPGYVWLTGGLRDASENGVTEPEDDDPDEEEGTVELLDEIQVAYSVGPINDNPSGFADNNGFEPVEQYTLREFLNRINNQPGTELSEGTMNAEQDGGTGEQGCFAGEAVHQVSVVWWLPIDHGNQVQSDSVSFDLGFYTEQCRHNDGEGMAPEPTTLTIDSPQGQGDGFANPWDVSETIAHVGSGSWGTVDRESTDSYKQGFYFAGDFDGLDELPSTYTVADIEEVSYWLYEPSNLDPSDIYLNIYTRPEGDSDDTVSWYDSRLQALPSDANGGSPNFTPGEWNEFSTASGASNTLTWSDGSRSGLDFTLPLPTLDDVQSDAIDWSTYGPSLSTTHDYRDEEVLALSLQVASNNTDLEAYIDDVTVRLRNGDTLRLDLEP